MPNSWARWLTVWRSGCVESSCQTSRRGSSVPASVIGRRKRETGNPRADHDSLARPAPNEVFSFRNPTCSGFVISYIISDEADNAARRGEQYANKLRGAGVNVTSVRLASMVQDFLFLDSLGHQCRQRRPSPRHRLPEMALQ